MTAFRLALLSSLLIHGGGLAAALHAGRDPGPAEAARPIVVDLVIEAPRRQGPREGVAASEPAAPAAAAPGSDLALAKAPQGEPARRNAAPPALPLPTPSTVSGGRGHGVQEGAGRVPLPREKPPVPPRPDAAEEALAAAPRLKDEPSEPREEFEPAPPRRDLAATRAEQASLSGPSAPVPSRPAPDPGMVAARYEDGALGNRPPEYPFSARVRGLEGRVTIAVAVSAEGGVLDASVKHSSRHPVLDRAALAAVREWRFVPARRGGEPVASSVDVPVVFRLKGQVSETGR